MSYFDKYIKYKLKYLKLLNHQSESLIGGATRYECKPDNKFLDICIPDQNGKYKSKDSCVNDCEGLFIRKQLDNIKIQHETHKFYLFVKHIIKEEKMKVYLKGGNVLGLKILEMIYDKYKNNDLKFKECFDKFLELDLIKDWDLSAYTGSVISDDYREKLDGIANQYKLVPRAKTFILYQTKHPILLEDKPLFEISIMDKDIFSKLEIPLTTMKVQVNEFNLKYVFMFCKEFYAYKIKKEPFDFDVLKRLISKIKIIIHPHKNGLYKIENNFDSGKINPELIKFIKDYAKNDLELAQFLAIHIEDPFRMLYRLVEKNIKKNNKIKDFLSDNLNIKNITWLFDEKYIRKHIDSFTKLLGQKLLDIYKKKFKESGDIITSLTTTGDFLKEISFNRIKSDYDMLQESGINLLKNLFQELIKNISKEELDKINIRDNFIEFIKFLSIKI